MPDAAARRLALRVAAARRVSPRLVDRPCVADA
jgi:hypothetical protein